jgi:glycosyltransferase involved in cell wall biosynthesis
MGTPGRKIIHAIAQLRFGAGRYVVDTAIEQQQRGLGAIEVVVSEGGDGAWVSSPGLVRELATHSIPVHSCGDFFHRETERWKRAADQLRQIAGPWHDESIVHAHTAPAAVVARWAGAPTVVATCHGWGQNRPPEFDLQDAIAFSLCDAVTSPSDEWAEVLRRRTALSKVDVHHIGIDLERYPPREHRRRPGPPRLVCVAEVTERKGPDVLLYALRTVWERFPEVELHWLGDGDRLEETRRQARTLDPSGARIVFHGNADRPYALLDDFDLFVLASRSDNQPLAIIEAMLAGLPIVSTHVGGIRALIERGRCGLVVPPEAPRALAMALIGLLESGETRRRELGTAGERFARATFDVRAHVTALAALYDRTRPKPRAVA